MIFDEPENINLFILEDSDGCSALSIPYRYITKRIFGKERKLSFLKYCTAHDEKYFFGGTLKQRWQADYELFQGMLLHATEATSKLFAIMYCVLAILMLIITRIFGSPYLPTPFRWHASKEYDKGYRYQILDIANNATVQTAADAEMIMTILESPWIPTATLSDAVDIYMKVEK